MSDLALARAEVPGTDLEAFCFHAQQAAEKAIKAVLLSHGIRFPFVHDLGALLEVASRNGVRVPDTLGDAGRLTDDAVLAQYPSADQVTEVEYREALRLARAVLSRAQRSASAGAAVRTRTTWGAPSSRSGIQSSDRVRPSTETSFGAPSRAPGFITRIEYRLVPYR